MMAGGDMGDDGGQGLADFLDATAPKPAARVVRLPWKRGKQKPAALHSCESTSTVRIVAGELPRVVKQIDFALRDADVFQRGGQLVRVTRLAEVGNDGMIRRSLGAAVVLQVEPAWLVQELGRLRTFQKFDKRSDDWLPTDCPDRVVNTYIASAGEWSVRVLRGIVECPIITESGEVVMRPGYHPGTGLLVDIAPDWPSIAPAPSREDARRALDFLMHPVRAVPFASDADRAVYAAAVCTAMIRPTLPSAPAFGYSATAAGSGKSKCADGVSIIAIGRRASAMAFGATEEETEKRLGGLLLAGDSIVTIDNIERPIGGEMVCSTLTQGEVPVRVLGSSKVVKLPTTTTIQATGNNLVLRGDINRRMLVSLIDPGMERPELRVFDFDMLDEIQKQRHELVNAAITIMLAYHRAGYPDQGLSPLGSFEEWSRRVRSALVWAGAADPVQVMERTRQRDPERETLAAIMAAWRLAFGASPTTVRDVLRTAEHDADLREAVEVLRVRGDLSRSLGRFLSKSEGRVMDDMRFIRAGVHRDGVVRWVLDAGLSGVTGVNSYTYRETVSDKYYIERKTPPDNPANPAFSVEDF